MGTKKAMNHHECTDASHTCLCGEELLQPHVDAVDVEGVGAVGQQPDVLPLLKSLRHRAHSDTSILGATLQRPSALQAVAVNLTTGREHADERPMRIW